MSSEMLYNVPFLYIYLYIYIYIYICIYYTHVITSRKLFKEMWQLTKVTAEMKPDSEQTMKLK